MYALRRVDLKEEKLRLSAATESAFFFFFSLVLSLIGNVGRSSPRTGWPSDPDRHPERNFVFAFGEFPPPGGLDVDCIPCSRGSSGQFRHIRWF